MAKVGTEKYSWGRHSGIGHHEFNIFFTKKTGFYANVPSDLVQYFPGNGNDVVQGKNYDDAVVNLKKKINSFYDAGIKQEKVIIYWLSWVAPNKYVDITGNESGFESNRVQVFNDDKFRNFSNNSEKRDFDLGFDYHIKHMTTIHKNIYITDSEIKSVAELSSNNVSRWHWSPSGGYSYIDWMSWEYMTHTPELEHWFEKTRDNLGRLIGIIADFFGKDKDHLIKNIESSTKQLFNQKLIN